MRRTWTIIGVRDVHISLKWYQSLLGVAVTAPAHDYFGQVLDSDGTVLLCLHRWGAHEHPTLMDPDRAAYALVGSLEEEPHWNPNTGTHEFSLRDPDGYYVTINAVSAR